MELIKHLNWRYATKIFDSTKKVSLTDLEKIKQAVQLSVSSYGLQLYKVLIIKNKAILRDIVRTSMRITDQGVNFVGNVEEFID